VWEHQALTRARYCAGDAQVGRRIRDDPRAILRKRETGVSPLHHRNAREAARGAPEPSQGCSTVKHDRRRP
jgi:glutamate-ammonia-ligase adenylyltransferase